VSRAGQLLAGILVLLAWAFASEADAHIYWTNAAEGDGTTIGRANLDGSGLNQHFISGADDPCGIAVDGSHVYWVNRDLNAIGRANLDGSGVDQTFVTTGLVEPCGVAVDGSHIWWANLGSGTGNAGSIGRANLDGSDGQAYISGGTVSNPIAVALNSQYAFWINTDLYGSDPVTPTIYRQDIDGGPPVKIQDLPTFLHFWPVATASRFYWAPYTFGIASTDLDGGDSATVAGSNAAGGIGILGQTIYWANVTEGTVSRANLDGSDPEFAFIRGLDHPFGLAVDAGKSPPFAFGRLTRNRDRGTATLKVILPGPGTVALTGKGLKPVSKKAPGGTVKIPIRATGKTRRRLNSRGRARVRAKITAFPDAGAPGSRTKRIKLLKR
jgi:virginiamycin B lyase